MKNLMKDIINEDVPLIGGGIGAGFVKNLAAKVTSNDKLQAAAPLVMGIFLKRQKNPMLRFAGMGMIATGGKELASIFIPGIKGIENMDLSGLFGGDSINERVINDTLNEDVINGNKDNGYDYEEDFQ